jgi:hypothetical protein
MFNTKEQLSSMETDDLRVLCAKYRAMISYYESRGRFRSEVETITLREYREMIKHIHEEQSRRIVQLPLF